MPTLFRPYRLMRARAAGRRKSRGFGFPGCGCGVIYEITAKGKEKLLHTFTGSDGAGYSSGVIKSNGLFYGTTASGGTHNDGVVFSVTKK